MASQITSVSRVFSNVASSADQRKHQSFAPLAFVLEIYWWPVNFPHKRPVTRAMFPFDDVIIVYCDMFAVIASHTDATCIHISTVALLWKITFRVVSLFIKSSFDMCEFDSCSRGVCTNQLNMLFYDGGSMLYSKLISYLLTVHTFVMLRRVCFVTCQQFILINIRELQMHLHLAPGLLVMVSIKL